MKRVAIGGLGRNVDIDWKVLPIYVTGFFVAMGVGIVGPLVPEFKAQFGVSYGEIGFMVSAFGLARVVLAIPAGYMADRWNKTLLLVIGTSIEVLAGVIGYLTPNFELLIVSRGLMGVGSGLVAGTAYIFVSEIAAPENRGKMLSLLNGSMMAGVSFSPAIGANLAVYFGWRGAFLFCGLIALISLVWVLLACKDLYPDDEIATGRRHSGKASGDASRITNAPGSRRWIYAIGAVFFFAFAIQFNWTSFRHAFIPLYGRAELGLDVGTIGWVLTVSSVVGALVLFLSGFVSDKFGRRAIIIPAMCCSAIGMLMIPLTQDFLPYLGAVLLISLGGMANSIPITLVADLSSPTALARTTGFLRFVGDLAHFAGPAILGTLMDHVGFQASVLPAFVMVFAATALVLVFARVPRFA